MLTIEEVFKLADTKGLKPKPWGSYILKTYNGFNHEQRVRKWQALNLAIQMGQEQEAHQLPCSVCGKSGGPETIAYHSEDYGSMTGHHPICKGCHTKVHNRFTSPQRWQEYISPFCDGSRWFENLPTNEHEQSVKKMATAPKIDAMHQIRVDFTKALGLDWAENPNPNSGYKYEHNLTHRQQYLDEAMRLRDQYADRVQQTGRGKDILEKMNRNLENRDRKTTWK